jgi:hypothetical protein
MTAGRIDITWYTYRVTWTPTASPRPSRCLRGPTRAGSTCASANSCTARSPSKPPTSTSASTSTSCAG